MDSVSPAALNSIYNLANFANKIAMAGRGDRSRSRSRSAGSMQRYGFSSFHLADADWTDQIALPGALRGVLHELAELRNSLTALNERLRQEPHPRPQRVTFAIAETADCIIAVERLQSFFGVEHVDDPPAPGSR